MASQKNETNNYSISTLASNTSVALPSRESPAVYLFASLNLEIPSYPYSIRRKLFWHSCMFKTSQWLKNALYDSEEYLAANTQLSLCWNACSQLLFQEQEGYLTKNLVPTSPNKKSTSNISLGVMALMSPGSVTFEEQVTFLIKSMDAMIATIRENDE